MTLTEIKEKLTPENIIAIMQSFGVEDYKEDDKSIQFPTICHNSNLEDASLKLYYYKENKLFHCYTECGESFDIYGLFKRVYECRGLQSSFKDIISTLSSYIAQPESGFLIDITPYTKQKLPEKRKEIILPEYPESVLDCFVDWPYQGWIDEGISFETMKKYNILFSISQNKVIIPHYDLNGRLVGIRGRALDEQDIALGKYRPVSIENITYSHPLSLNLYGLNLSIEDINRTGTVILFEGEKSVLLYDSYFHYNNSVAVCGSSLNKNQILLLLRHTKAKNIILAFDKEYDFDDSNKRESYINKLRSFGEKYNKYFNFYYLADKENLLELKDSPIDKGKEIFDYLLSKKMKVI